MSAAADLVMLAGVAAAESVVYAWRYSAANKPCARSAALSTVAVCTLRVVFTAGGVSAAIKGTPVLAVAAVYAGVAGAATWAVHRWFIREKSGKRGSGEEGIGDRPSGIGGKAEGA